ncbi:MAG: CBS domain-containing protein [Gammaproteobacteria bacterium]|nr:CBS domain-containing protein [Gammaproteobacteria bacterium]
MGQGDGLTLIKSLIASDSIMVHRHSGLQAMRTIPVMKNVMTPFPYAVELQSSLADAQALMREHHVRHLPVIDERALAGVLSDRDIKLLLGPDFDYPEPGGLSVADAYQPESYTVDLNAPLDMVLLEMAERHVGSVVVTRKGKLAGIFTATDACREFGLLLQKRRGGPDEAA